MNYREKLLKIRALKPTETMFAMAKEKREKATNKAFHNGSKNYIFYRTCLEDGILKISLFLSEDINNGECTPYYDVFLDYEKRKDLVYDHRKQKWKYSILYNLQFPAHTNYAPILSDRYVFEEEQGQVHDYVFRKSTRWCAKNIWCSIVHFQEKNREIKWMQKQEKISAQVNKKMELIPALPGNWEKWLGKVGADKNYIFYDAGKNVQTGYCTYCEKKVPVIKPKYNKLARCHRCRKKIQYKSNGKRGTILDKYEVYLLQNCGEEFVLRAFFVQKMYSRQDFAPEIQFIERRRLFYQKDFSMEEYHYKICEWWCGWKKGRLRIGGLLFGYLIGYPQGRVYGKTLPSLSKTFLKHTGFREFFQKENRFCPEKYFETYENMPSIEQLVKSGLYAIVRGILNGGEVAIDDSKTDLLGKLGINHAQLLRLRKGESIERLEWLQYENSAGRQLEDNLVTWYIEQGLSPESISFINGRMSEVQIKNYLSRQALECGKTIEATLQIWIDYLKMADSLGLDTQDAIIYKTRKLIQRHEEAAWCLRRKKLQTRIAEKEAAFPTIKQIYSTIREKYEYRSEREAYEVLVPNGIEDIFEEGKCLKHCIDVNDYYLKKIADRETYILFLRKKEHPLQPYFTLEVEPNGTVRQKSTYFNRQEKNMDEINKFLKRWQNVIRKRLSRQDTLWADESKKKREKEFRKLREEKKIIFAGTYNGRLLADVLEDNLLEADEDAAA